MHPTQPREGTSNLHLLALSFYWLSEASQLPDMATEYSGEEDKLLPIMKMCHIAT